jgi:CheY-like chemotaxis protein
VAEDNELARKLVCTMLTSLGYQVLAAETVESCIALAGANRNSIELLLTDVIMPGINGQDLYDLLRCDRPDLKALFMSGYFSNVIEHQGILDKGRHFIQKPFTLPVLSAKIRQVLEMKA